MKNRLEKFLAALSGFFLMVVIVLGIKINNDNKKINLLLEGLNADSVGSGQDSPQNKISQNREKTLSQVAHAPATDTVQHVTTKTVVPGKVTTSGTTTYSSGSAQTSNKTTKKS